MNGTELTWLASPMIQQTFTVTTSKGASEVHLSVQPFQDYMWVILTEEENVAPGTVIRYDDPNAGPNAFIYEGEKHLRSTECCELLGLRDHPLTQISASVIVNTMRQVGSTKPILMYLNVYHMSKALKGTSEKRDFLKQVERELTALVGGGEARVPAG